MTDNILNTGHTYPKPKHIEDVEMRVVAQVCQSLGQRRKPEIRKALTDAVDVYGWSVVAAYLRSDDAQYDDADLIAEQIEKGLAEEHAARYGEGRLRFDTLPAVATTMSRSERAVLERQETGIADEAEDDCPGPCPECGEQLEEGRDRIVIASCPNCGWKFGLFFA